MSELIPIALYGWPAVVLALFSALPARRAVIVSFLGAWLFLPQAQIPFQGLPDLNKITVTSFAVLAGALLFDAGRLLRYRFHWVDLPMIVWCCTPGVSSLTNGLGAYDGLAVVLDQVALWGVPYVMGRIYFNDLTSLRELAIGIFIGGLIYAPLCLLEVRFSPQLHRWVYGFHQHSFGQTMRWGGYRPMVFMQHGLMVGLWMTSATLVSFWFWASGTLGRFWGLMAPISIGMFGVCVLCKSTGAFLLLVGGLGVLVVIRQLRKPLLLAGVDVRAAILAVVLIGFAPAYIAARIQGGWDGRQLVQLAERISEDRAESLQGRLHNEVLLVEKAMQRKAFGWGTWGRWRVKDVFGEDITTADSLWIIALGQTGLVGLTSVLAVALLPVVLLMRRVPLRYWLNPAIGSAAVLAMLLVLYLLDGLLNAMLNPIFMLAAGGLSGFYIIAPRLRSARAAARGRATAAASAPSQPAPGQTLVQ